MKKKATRITGVRFSEATYKAVVQTTKSRDYVSTGQQALFAYLDALTKVIQ